MLDIIEYDISQNPEERILIEESYRGMDEKIMKTLSRFEKSVLKHYLGGDSYAEISDKIGKPVKSIDNALQRIKKKLEKYYEDVLL